jgi:hypothetical protein
MSAPRPDPMLKRLLTEPPHATERLRWLALEYREAYRGGDVERVIQILDEAESPRGSPHQCLPIPQNAMAPTN